ncbi:MAG: methyltransferase domain-containing protein [Acidithiobacillus ferrivorans]
MKCRHCHAPLQHVFLDLGFAPPSNAYLSADDLLRPEIYFPLKLYVCEHCWLVQTEDYAVADELFRPDYAYFSSISQSWLDHAARYTGMITERLALGKHSLVIEVAANDGYLLKNFVAAGIPCLGIEPTAGTAEAAENLGIPVLREFFGQPLAQSLVTQGQRADLIIGNNVYAHVPDINEFTAGLKTALKDDGTITLEFPHLMRLLENTQFDTVYHEHFSYLSLYTVSRIFAAAGLRVWDVEALPTHGGSLRIYGCHKEDKRNTTPAVAKLLQVEEQAGLRNLETYRSFQVRADQIKDDLVTFLIAQKRAGKSVAAYGAAAKGNTLLNYAGIKPDLLPYVCDAAPSKQGKYLPGSHIPVLSPTVLKERRPDILLILPWNIADEVRLQHGYIHDWGGQFAVAVPKLVVSSATHGRR